MDQIPLVPGSYEAPPLCRSVQVFKPQYPGTYAVWCQKEGVTEPDSVSRIKQVLYNRASSKVILPLVLAEILEKKQSSGGC